MEKIKKILIIDDNQEEVDSIAVSLFYKNYEVDFSSKIEDALAFFFKNLYSIVIINLDSSIKNINKFFEEINNSHRNIVYILLNNPNITHKLSKFNQNGIFLFVKKPVDTSILVEKVELAHQIILSQSNAKNKKKEELSDVSGSEIISEVKQKISNNIETLRDSSLFHTLKNVLTQGSGFGMLISLVSYLEDGSEITENNYIVDKEIGDLLIQHSKFAHKTVELIDQLHNITKHSIRTYKVRADTIPKLVNKVTEKLESRIQIKNNKISLGLNSELSNYSLYINEEILEQAISELVLNALKYSVDNTPIMVTYNHVKNYITTSISNVPEIEIKTKELDNWFIPFYREQQVVDERYESLDFGLGLTFVQKVIQQHNGNISLDHLNVHLFGGKKMLNVSIHLPIF